MRLACALLPMVSALAAMGTTPARAAVNYDVKERARARKVAGDYAACVVKEHAAKASDAIIADSDNDDILHRYPMLIDSECMGRTGGSVSMTFGGDTFRYAIADALVRARFTSAGDSSFASKLPLAHPHSPTSAEAAAALAKCKGKSRCAKIKDDIDKAIAVAWLSRFGECVVRQSPEKARMWVLTLPDGPEETSRVRDLQSEFNNCLMGGDSMKFDRATMRGLVAVNYYRLAMATPVIGKVQ